MLGPMVGEDRGADDNSASGHSPPGPVPPGRGGSRCEPHAVIGPSPDLNPPGTRRRWWPRPPREDTGWPCSTCRSVPIRTTAATASTAPGPTGSWSSHHISRWRQAVLRWSTGRSTPRRSRRGRRSAP